METTKTILICGSRVADTKLKYLADMTVKYCKSKGYSVICGDALGIDSQVWWSCVQQDVPFMVYGVAALPRNNAPMDNYEIVRPARNYEQRDNYMASRANVVVAIWNGVSKGTVRVAQYALSQGKTLQFYKGLTLLSSSEFELEFKDA